MPCVENVNLYDEPFFEEIDVRFELHMKCTAQI
jgi:hypothetical protein